MDTHQIDSILTFLCEELGGDWFLTGGSLVRLKFDAHRGTEDMDLVRIRDELQSEERSRTRLFEWLMQHNLGPEWVNTAVEPFVKRVPNWESEVIELRAGRIGRVFRPNLTFFIYLKLGRATSADWKDIEKAIPHCLEGFDWKKFEEWATEKVKPHIPRLLTLLPERHKFKRLN